MRNDVALLDLRLRRRSMIGYTAGIAVYAFVIVALYPSFRHDTSLNQFTGNGSTRRGVVRRERAAHHPAGWLNAKRSRRWLQLLTNGYGGSCLVGQDEDAPSTSSRRCPCPAGESCWRRRRP